MTLTLIQGLIFIIYVGFIWKKFGVLQSISDSWYKLRTLGGMWYWLFTLFCWGLAVPMLFQAGDSTTSLFIYSGAGLAFVGAASMFKLKDTFVPYIHFGGAAFGIILALLGIGIERHGWIPLIVFGIAAILITLLKVKNSTWWIEIAAFVTVLSGLLIY